MLLQIICGLKKDIKRKLNVFLCAFNDRSDNFLRTKNVKSTNSEQISVI